MSSEIQLLLQSDCTDALELTKQLKALFRKDKRKLSLQCNMQFPFSPHLKFFHKTERNFE